MDIFVSIIVPVYKVEKYLERCIDSILSQSYKNYEIILVDDGSPDNCGKICDKYSSEYNFIKTIHKKNEGLGLARNSGLEIAQGKYVMFVDSDDYVEKDLLFDMVQAVKREQADTVIAGYSRSQNGKILTMPNPTAGKKYEGESIISEVLIKMVGPAKNGEDTINMAVWRVLYSMDIIKKYGITFPSEREFISEDIIFDLKYYPNSKVVCGIENSGYIYCMNPGSLTEKYNCKRFELGKTLFLEKKRMLQELGIYELGKFRAEESFLRYSRYCIKSEIKFLKENGKDICISNIKRIISDSLLVEVLNTHNNRYIPFIDKVVNLGIKNHNAILIYIFLRLGYLLKGL